MATRNEQDDVTLGGKVGHGNEGRAMEEGLKSRCVGAAQSEREQSSMLSLLRALVTPPSYIPTVISVFTVSRVLSTRITASRSLRTSEKQPLLRRMVYNTNLSQSW